jgi:large subunit ribosomal protein L2
MALNQLCRTKAFTNQKKIFLLNPRRLKKLKNKTVGCKKKGGRNHKGIITVRHKGGGNKTLLRKIESFSQLETESFLIESLEYEPNRNVKIARLFSAISKRHFYCIAISGLEVGFILKNTFLARQQDASIFGPLSNIPLGTLINSIGTEFRMFQRILQRSAGTFAQLIQKGDFFCIVRLCSGKQISLKPSTFASVGVISNSTFQKLSLGSAGFNRRKKNRPTVRGVAMNSNDHPHGGGEAKSTPGRPSVNPWGFPAHSRKN